MGFVGPLSADEKTKRSKAEMIALLTERPAISFGGWLDTLSDDFSESARGHRSPGTPPQMRASRCCWAAKEHEMHHRGQLMLMERMVGVVPHPSPRRMQARMAQMQQDRPAGTAS